MQRTLNINDLKRMLRISDPFLFIESVDNIVPKKSGIGRKFLKQDEWFFENYEKGSVFLFGPIQVIEDEVLEFAKLYDPQPFHIDHEAAMKSTYRGLIASGWQTCAFVRPH